jgi:3-oxoacyl-(acyl-carrier-protein) synthase
MRAALAEAGVGPETVDAVFAAAAGARAEDACEARALLNIFERPVPVVATKALFGETLGAAGALAAVAAVHALGTGILPGTPTDEPEFSLDLVREPRQAPLQRVLVNAFDARGGCVSILLGKA